MHFQPNRYFTINPLTIAIAITTLGLGGCASQPLAAQKDPIHHQVISAYEAMLGKQSYAYDMNVSIQTSPARLTTDIAPTPKRDALITTWANDKKLTPEQQTLIQTAQRYQRVGEVDPFKVLGIFGKRFHLSAQGVMDLGHGQFSVAPQLNYRQPNAASYLKVPMAVDLKNAKFYVDMSVASELVTDPKYDGRYIELDYGKWLKEKKIDLNPWLQIVKDASLITPTLAREKDYQVMPLTAEDRKKGINQKIGYQLNYHEAFANYLLYLYLNSDYFKNLLAQNQDSVTDSATLITDILKSSKPVGNDDQAYEAALRVYRAIEAAQDSAAQAPSSTDNPEPYATDSDGSEPHLDAHESTDDEGHMQQALQAFNQYKTDKYTPVANLKNIIATNPRAMAQLRLAAAEDLKTMINTDDVSTIEYGFNRHKQLISLVSLSPFPKVDSIKTQPAATATAKPQIKSVMNFYNYGKARVDPAIFANAVTWKEATKEDSIVAVTKKNAEFKKQKNLETFAQSLFRQDKSYIQTYETLYEYQYLLNQSEEDLQHLNQAQLKTTAKQLAINSALENNIDITNAHATSPQALMDQNHESAADDYEDSNIKDEVQEAVNHAYLQQQSLNNVKKWRQQGLTDAVIFSKLYTTLQADDAAAETYHYESEAQISNSPEQDACELLLDSDQLDKKSHRTLSKICAKLPQEAAAVEAKPAQPSQQAQARKQAFAELLGNIAVQDMQQPSADNTNQDQLIKKIEPFIDESYSYSESAYREAYRIMLLSK